MEGRCRGKGGGGEAGGGGEPSTCKHSLYNEVLI